MLRPSPSCSFLLSILQSFRIVVQEESEQLKSPKEIYLRYFFNYLKATVKRDESVSTALRQVG